MDKHVHDRLVRFQKSKLFFLLNKYHCFFTEHRAWWNGLECCGVLFFPINQVLTHYSDIFGDNRPDAGFAWNVAALEPGSIAFRFFPSLQKIPLFGINATSLECFKVIAGTCSPANDRHCRTSVLWFPCSLFGAHLDQISLIGRLLFLEMSSVSANCHGHWFSYSFSDSQLFAVDEGHQVSYSAEFRVKDSQCNLSDRIVSILNLEKYFCRSLVLIINIVVPHVALSILK